MSDSRDQKVNEAMEDVELVDELLVGYASLWGDSPSEIARVDRARAVVRRLAAVSAPAPDRQKAAQCPACGVACFVDVGGALCDYRTMRFHACAVQDDIAAILRALGLSDHARPVSAHAVVRDEILPAIAALRQGSHA